MNDQERLDKHSKVLVATGAIAYMSHAICSIAKDLDLVSHVDPALKETSIESGQLIGEVVKTLGELMEKMGDYMNTRDMCSPLDIAINERAFKVMQGYDLIEDPEDMITLDERIEGQDLEVFKIQMSDNILSPVEGYRITIENLPCFIFRETFGWNVSHLETGMTLNECVSSCTTAIDEATMRIQKAPKDFLDEARAKTIKQGHKLPINV